MITVENLSKRYAGGEAVKGISFTVEKGEIVGFLGPNGAGKTALSRRPHVSRLRRWRSGRGGKTLTAARVDSATGYEQGGGSMP